MLQLDNTIETLLKELKFYFQLNNEHNHKNILFNTSKTLIQSISTVIQSVLYLTSSKVGSYQYNIQLYIVYANIQ